MGLLSAGNKQNIILSKDEIRFILFYQVTSLILTFLAMRDYGGSFFWAATVSVILTQIKPTPSPSTDHADICNISS